MEKQEIPTHAYEQNLSYIMKDFFISLDRNYGRNFPPNGLYQRLSLIFDREIVSYALLITNGNQSRASELLGINRNTLRKRAKEYGLIASDSEDEEND